MEEIMATLRGGYDHGKRVVVRGIAVEGTTRVTDKGMFRDRYTWQPSVDGGYYGRYEETVKF